MAEFLSITPSRLEWAGREGIVKREADGCYRPEIVTAQWLKYERGRSAKGQRQSEFERQRARLTAAKATVAERKLMQLDRALVGTNDIIEQVKTVSLRIRNKLLTAVPRIARSCYAAPSAAEAVKAARAEFDVVILELSSLEDGGKDFEVVHDANDSERPAAG